MILGFAHISCGARKLGPRIFDIPSAPEKWPLMWARPNHHNLHIASLSVPIEVVSYETELVKMKGRIECHGGGVVVFARAPQIEARFFTQGLGFNEDLFLASRVPAWRVGLRIDTDPHAPIDPPLDIEGYAALAFYSSDAQADRDHLLAHGGLCATEPFTVKLGREMKIVMLRSPEGTIIELIEVLG